MQEYSLFRSCFALEYTICVTFFTDYKSFKRFHYFCSRNLVTSLMTMANFCDRLLRMKEEGSYSFKFNPDGVLSFLSYCDEVFQNFLHFRL